MKDIPGYEGLYKATETGQIYNCKKKRFLKQNTKEGYIVVNLMDADRKHHTEYVHRLVALAYLEKEPHQTDVNHINEDKRDNRVENLEWCTRRYNINYGERNKKASEKLKQAWQDGRYDNVDYSIQNRSEKAKEVWRQRKLKKN